MYSYRSEYLCAQLKIDTFTYIFVLATLPAYIYIFIYYMYWHYVPAYI